MKTGTDLFSGSSPSGKGTNSVNEQIFTLFVPPAKGDGMEINMSRSSENPGCTPMLRRKKTGANIKTCEET